MSFNEILAAIFEKETEMQQMMAVGIITARQADLYKALATEMQNMMFVLYSVN